MHARRVSFELKTNTINDFNRRQETEILPVLRKQKGFQDLITLVAPDKRHVQAITIWDKIENAEAYDQSAYPEITRLLSNVTDGKPKVETLEVSATTLHKAAMK
jgi:hypothetical protein